jgi:hypothetical protein
MMTKKINRKSLLENLLPNVIVQRTLGQLPVELKKLYLAKTEQGLKVSIGLDMKLGFYMIEQGNALQVELLWCENQGCKGAA